MVADKAVQERAAGAAPPARLAPGYIHTTHPDTGIRVVFLPGELLPAWVEVPKQEASETW